MQELTLNEAEEVKGGWLPVVGAIAVAYGVGWVAGYVGEKYDQYKEGKKQDEAVENE